MGRTMIALAVAMVALAGEAHNVRIDTSPDRVKTPLAVDMERIGTLRPRSVAEIGDSNWTIGCETLDRDFADFEQYKTFLAPLGIKTIRLQGGWAKCETEKGKYDFSWLDRIVDYARSQGLNVLLETGYGNPIYEGGGGKDLMGSFPTSDEALAAWDAWVAAMAERYKGRVRDWAMWNEPDIGKPKKSVEDIVAFNLRTAKIIKRIIPDSRIAGLSLAKNDPDRLEKYLQAMGEGVALFDWFIYHGYAPAPESSYENVEKQKEVLRKYSQTAKMRQGENGCPSEMTFKFTLKEISWSEYSQAKWNMRRMLGDFGHDVESSVFTICDFNHIGKEMNLKGLLRADRRHNVIAVKRAYYAVQNVAGVFDSSLARVPGSNYRQGFGTKDASITSYEYRKNGTGERLFVFWTHGKDIAFERPGDSFETRPAVFMCSGEPLKDPIWVDLLSGRVYVFPKDRVIVSGPDEIRYLDVPVYDSPCVLTERSALEIDTGMNPDVARPCRDVRFSPLGAGTMLYGDPVHLVDGQPFAKDPTVIRLGGRFAELGRNFVQRVGAVALIGLETGVDKPDDHPAFAGIFQMERYRDQQTRWLAEEIEKPAVKTAKFKVAICHIPLFHADWRNPKLPAGDGPINGKCAAWSRPCVTRWRPLLEKAGVNLVVAGHRHVYHRDAPDAERSWTQIVVGGCPAGPHPKGFATVTEGFVEDGRLRVRVHDVSNGRIVLDEAIA